MESRAEMLERHARELAELDSLWWEQDFTEDPWKHYCKANIGNGVRGWIVHELPTILRKREKIGVTITWHGHGRSTALVICGVCHSNEIALSLAEKLAGRTLAPGERVEL